MIKVTGKRNKQRIVPFTNTMKESLINYMAVRLGAFGDECGNHLFLTDKGEAIYNKLIYRVVT